MLLYCDYCQAAQGENILQSFRRILHHRHFKGRHLISNPACSPVMASSIGNDTPLSPGSKQQRMHPAANDSTDQDEDSRGRHGDQMHQHNHSTGSKLGEDSYPSSPSGGCSKMLYGCNTIYIYIYTLPADSALHKTR